MKKTLLFLTLVVALVAFTAQADLVIYRTTQRARYIGSGADFYLPTTGYAILDADTGKGYSITLATVQGDKLFMTSTFDDTRVYHVTGRGARAYTVFCSNGVTNKPAAFEDKGEFLIGLDTPLAITTNRTIRFPRVIAGESAGVLIGTNAVPFAVQGRGIASFSFRETRYANGLGETVDAAFERYRQAVIARGYTDVTQ
jgi:hypothetical protein